MVIPYLREVISGSGTNTEMISAYVDHFAKKYVIRYEMYLEDTPDALRLYDDINRLDKLPPGVRSLEEDQRN